MWVSSEIVREALVYQKEGKYSLAHKKLLEASKTQNPEAHFLLNHLYLKGGCLFHADSDLSNYHFGQAKKYGCPWHAPGTTNEERLSWYLDGNYMLRDDVYEEIRENFEEFLLRDAEAGDAESQFEMFRLLQDKNKETAFVFLYKAASQAHCQAMLRLSEMYYDNADRVEGARWAIASKREDVISMRIYRSNNPDELYVFGYGFHMNPYLRGKFIFSRVECTFESYYKTHKKYIQGLITWFLICVRGVYPISKDIRIIIAKMLIQSKEKASEWLTKEEIAQVLKLK
jgi:TPR repeat protein